MTPINHLIFTFIILKSVQPAVFEICDKERNQWPQETKIIEHLKTIYKLEKENNKKSFFETLFPCISQKKDKRNNYLQEQGGMGFSKITNEFTLNSSKETYTMNIYSNLESNKTEETLKSRFENQKILYKIKSDYILKPVTCVIKRNSKGDLNSKIIYLVSENKQWQSNQTSMNSKITLKEFNSLSSDIKLIFITKIADLLRLSHKNNIFLNNIDFDNFHFDLENYSIQYTNFDSSAILKDFFTAQNFNYFHDSLLRKTNLKSMVVAARAKPIYDLWAFGYLVMIMNDHEFSMHENSETNEYPINMQWIDIKSFLLAFERFSKELPNKISSSIKKMVESKPSFNEINAKKSEFIYALAINSVANAVFKIDEYAIQTSAVNILTYLSCVRSYLSFGFNMFFLSDWDTNESVMNSFKYLISNPIDNNIGLGSDFFTEIFVPHDRSELHDKERKIFGKILTYLSKLETNDGKILGSELKSLPKARWNDLLKEKKSSRLSYPASSVLFNPFIKESESSIAGDYFSSLKSEYYEVSELGLESNIDGNCSEGNRLLI
jgi:hypothetical protein